MARKIRLRVDQALVTREEIFDCVTFRFLRQAILRIVEQTHARRLNPLMRFRYYMGNGENGSLSV